MKNLELRELSTAEMMSIGGGSKGRILRKIWDAVTDLVTALELADAVDEFVAGWNSVECN